MWSPTNQAELKFPCRGLNCVDPEGRGNLIKFTFRGALSMIRLAGQLQMAWVAFAVMLSWFQPTAVQAQAKLNEGEEVRVHFLNTWYEGVVVGRDKAKWIVEFVFANRPKREQFERTLIRKLCEFTAMDYARTWSSSNGKFSVVAAMKGVSNDEVLLIKEDMEEIQVPLASLSQEDVNYIKKMQRQYEQAVMRGEVPAITPNLPEVEEFGSGGFGVMASFVLNSDQVAPLGAVPDFMRTFRQAGTGFMMSRKRQEVVAVIPVGGPEQLVLLTARENNFFNGNLKFQSQLYWVSLKNQKMLGYVAVTSEDFPVDYDPTTRLLLTVTRSERRFGKSPDIFTLWYLEPGASEATPLQRWNGQVEIWHDSPFAKLVDNQIVVAKTDGQSYVAWNFVEKSVAYRFKAASFFDAPVILSYDRRHLIVPEDGKVTVVNAVTGEPEFVVAVDDRHVSGANISPDGTRLLALTERNVYVWDLASGNPKPQVYPAPLIGSPFKSRVEWVTDDLILAESHQERVLYRLSLALPVWSYRMDVESYWLNRDPLKNMIVDGLFFYIAKPSAFDGSIAVGAVSLPGPGVEEITRKIDREALWIVKPGVPVGIELGAVSDPAKVQQWLQEKIVANGWIYDPQAEIKLHASMGTGPTQTETYRQIGFGGGETTVSFTPHYASLVMKKGNLIIWQTGSTSGAPPIIMHGDNLQGQISRMQVPQIEFFRMVNIEDKIIDPQYSRGFGVSQLGLRGIQVISTSPPGREDNPLDAERQMKDDQERERQRQREEFR